MRGRLAIWIDFLRSKEAILLVLILALFAQLPHTAVVFHRVSTAALAGLVTFGFDVGLTVDWLHSYMAAIAVEVAVLVFVVRGKSLLSWLFAGCSAAMNLIYYWRPGWDIREPNPLIIGAVLWSVLLPAAIAFYSHEIGDGETHKEHRSVWARISNGISRLFPPRQQNVMVPAVAVATNGNGAVVKPNASRTTSNGNGAVPTTVTFDAFAAAFADSTQRMSASLNGTTENVAPEVGEGITQIDRVEQMDLEGLTTKQIAEALGVSDSTVRVYRKQYKDRNKEQL